MQTRYRNEIHIVEREFAQFGYLRLDEDGRFRRVDAARKVVERDLDYVLTNLFGVVGVVGQCLRVSYHDENLLELARILQLHTASQRADEVSQMEASRRTVAR